VYKNGSHQLHRMMLTLSRHMMEESPPTVQ
jgi:hypothetical protein